MALGGPRGAAGAAGEPGPSGASGGPGTSAGAVRFVLAYRALGLGDFLTGVPALRALARAFPEARLVLAAPKAIAPLAALTGAVDEVVDTAPLGAAPPGADLAVNLHGRGPQSTEVLEASLPGRLIAFGRDGVDWRASEHEVARWCRLLEAHGLPADPADLSLAPVPGSPMPGATVVHPGAASPARRWPPERFAAIVREEAAAGRTVAITGGAGERALAQEVQRLAGTGEVLAGETDLLGLAAIVSGAERVICGDTGVAHLATAFGTSSVVLFGPVSPAEWGPPAGDGRHVALWTGRTGDPHGTRTDPGLLEITVPDVRHALRQLEPVAS